ncbi:MAG: 3-oxoacyl-ACP reductase, partial [Burkholderiales bacterium]
HVCSSDLAATEMNVRMARGVLQHDGSMRVEPRMDVNHVAQTIVQIVGLPLETNVQFVTIMATKMPFVGRG